MRLGRLPGNFSFVKENIFDPQLKVQPTAVVNARMLAPTPGSVDGPAGQAKRCCVIGNGRVCKAGRPG
jgi:hypothetical protein